MSNIEISRLQDENRLLKSQLAARDEALEIRRKDILHLENCVRTEQGLGQDLTNQREALLRALAMLRVRLCGFLGVKYSDGPSDDMLIEHLERRLLADAEARDVILQIIRLYGLPDNTPATELYKKVRQHQDGADALAIGARYDSAHIQALREAIRTVTSTTENWETLGTARMLERLRDAIHFRNQVTGDISGTVMQAFDVDGGVSL